jgi:hypothetical protein
VKLPRFILNYRCTYSQIQAIGVWLAFQNPEIREIHQTQIADWRDELALSVKFSGSDANSVLYGSNALPFHREWITAHYQFRATDTQLQVGDIIREVRNRLSNLPIGTTQQLMLLELSKLEKFISSMYHPDFKP